MNLDTLTSLMREDLKTVGVKFRTASSNGYRKVYVYKTLIDFEEGDFATVNVAGEYKVVKVVEIHETPNLDLEFERGYNWIVGKVDVEAYEKVLEKDKELSVKLQDLKRKTLINNAKNMLADQLGIEAKDISGVFQ